MEDMRNIVKTMKNISSANIAAYEKKVSALREYIKTVEMGFQILSIEEPNINMRIRVESYQKEDRIGMIVLGSERGLCGDFNERILSFFLEKKEKQKEKKCFPIAIGERIANKMGKEEGLRVYPFPSSFSNISDLLRELLPILRSWIEKDGVSQISFFYNQLVEGKKISATEKLLFPLNYFWWQELKEELWQSSSIPTYRSSTEDLFFSLMQEYHYATIYQAFAESLASEQLSRLSSMQSAEENIDEKKNVLQKAFHTERQKEITEELFDIISGFETLKKKG